MNLTINRGLIPKGYAVPALLATSVVLLQLQVMVIDKSWMKKGPVSASNKWNISVVIEAHVWIIPRRIQEQVSEKRSPVCTHMYTDCLEKHPPNITIRYQCLKLEHFDDISFREMFGRIRVLLVFIRQNKKLTCYKMIFNP